MTGQLLPAFGTAPLDRITEGRVRRWFERYSRTAMPIMSWVASGRS